MPALDIPVFQKSLLSWYGKNARDLPWRRTKDPYKIWISEIMLQQTQVITVIPYYEKWMKRFLDIGSLAKAPQAEVMKFWAGLGYYRRARMIHEAAKQIVKTQNSRLPETIEGLLELPGIGRYTAGAIASIAFNQSAPILDGNVIRILSRLTGFKKDIGSPANIQSLWKIAEKAVPEKNPGDFNQAMMELGATVCVPQNPKCLICPVSALCFAYKKSSPENFPVKKVKTILEKIKTAALILKNKDKILIQRQPKEARWGGMWMFPHGTDLKSMQQKLALGKEALKHRLTVHHGFTKYQVRLDVYEGLCANEKIECREAAAHRWVKVTELSKFAFPSPHQKIVHEILKNP